MTGHADEVNSYLKKNRQLICPLLKTYLDDYLRVHQRFDLDKEFINYAQELACSGKMVRAALLLSVIDILGQFHYRDQAKIAAVAIELFGTGILIHDDVIDRSSSRRGLPTAHYKFAQLAIKRGYQHPQQFGISAAICIADALFFLAEELLVNLELPPNIYRALLLKSNRELSLLVYAEMEDVRLASSAEMVTQEDIYKMYIGKTGRYTGRWPLLAGGLLAELDPPMIADLEQIGDQLGLVYQLADDKLGMFGDESQTGKSSTSDVLSGKKTLYYFYMHSNLEITDRNQILKIYGNIAATDKEINWLKKRVKEVGIYDQVDQEIRRQSAHLTELLYHAKLDPKLKEWLMLIAAAMTDRSQ